MAAKAGGPNRPPSNIEDFLWNMHSVLVSTPGPLVLDNLKEAYSKRMGHKCIIERFLVVGEGGLAATLKRIPHMVTLFTDDKGALCVKATQPENSTKEQLIAADSAYRRELIKKNAAAKAKAAVAAGAKAPAGASAAAPSATQSTSSAETPAKAAAPASEKRPADSAAGADAKKPRTDGSSADAEALARMLVQGVVRVLQNRAKAGKGPLPISELEEEFKVLWKVPFNLQQAGEKDAVSFLQKWPLKVEVTHDGTQHLVQLAKGKPKAGAEEPAAKKAGDGGAPPKAATGAANAKGAPAAQAPPSAAEGPPPKQSAPSPQGAAANGGPLRPPASLEDFLWNLHTVIDSYGGPVPLDQLKDAYSKRLGHKCSIERFLVVGEGGLGATLKRIPHVVTVETKDDETVLKSALPSGTTREGLIATDHQYRRQIAQKNAAARAKASGAPAAGSAAPEAAAPPAAGAAAAQNRQAAEPAAGEKDAKKPRGEEAETLSRMLVQGLVRVLQNRQKDGKGPLPINVLEEEFKALWKVPFNCQQAGETDVVSFLNKWPKKVEVVKTGPADGGFVVQLAGKAAAKAKAPLPAPAAATNSGDAEAEAAEPGTPAAALEAAEREASDILATMQEAIRRQEDLVRTLRELKAQIK